MPLQSDCFTVIQVVYQFTFPSVPKNIGDLIPVHVPTWVTSDADTDKIKATWLGYDLYLRTCALLTYASCPCAMHSHACFLLELPSPTGATRGPRVILDPVLTPRCSPVKFVGPKRFTGASHISTLYTGVLSICCSRFSCTMRNWWASGHRSRTCIGTIPASFVSIIFNSQVSSA